MKIEIYLRERYVADAYSSFSGVRDLLRQVNQKTYKYIYEKLDEKEDLSLVISSKTTFSPTRYDSQFKLWIGTFTPIVVSLGRELAKKIDFAFDNSMFLTIDENYHNKKQISHHITNSIYHDVEVIADPYIEIILDDDASYHMRNFLVLGRQTVIQSPKGNLTFGKIVRAE